MSQITTHILDTSVGKPASGVSVSIEYYQDKIWKKVGSGVTDKDGRIKNLVPDTIKTDTGLYRLKFETQAYFDSHGIKAFYPSVTIEFEITDGTHYHVPLLLNPFGYSTYRGS